MKLGKEERLRSRSLIEKLFSGDSAESAMSFPLRIVYMTGKPAQDGACVKILVSVPKRHFRHAVDRNRVKRQIREAYRKNKTILEKSLAARPDEMVVVAFVWTDSSHRKSSEVEHRVKSLLQRVAERLESV